MTVRDGARAQESKQAAQGRQAPDYRDGDQEHAS